MKPLSKQREGIVAQTLREAHWPASASAAAGQPVCPDCHDGVDVLTTGRMFPSLNRFTRSPFLRVYYCRACRRRFNDLTGTPLEHTWAPLSVWAGAACLLATAPHLGKQDVPWSAFDVVPGWRELPGPQRRTLRDVFGRLAAWDFGLRWATLLKDRGFCAKRVAVAAVRLGSPQAVAPVRGERTHGRRGAGGGRR